MLATSVDLPQVSGGSNGSSGRVTRTKHAVGGGWFESHAANENTKNQCREITDWGTKHQWYVHRSVRHISPQSHALPDERKSVPAVAWQPGTGYHLGTFIEHLCSIQCFCFHVHVMSDSDLLTKLWCGKASKHLLLDFHVHHLLDVILVIGHANLSPGFVHSFCHQFGVSPRHLWALLQA